MVTCAVTSCKNTSAKISKNKNGITFHRFPRDQERRKQWELAVNRKDWSSSSSSTVCSEHFDVEDFYLTEHGLRRLSLTAVPAINILPYEPSEPRTCRIEPVDIQPTDTPQVIELKLKVKRLEVIADDRKRRLNLMGQSKRRLRRKVERLKLMIKHLIQNKKKELEGG